MKFYAVAVGHSPGVYTTWEKCEDQVKGFPGNKYKSFKTQREAEAYVEENKQAKEDEVKYFYAVAVGQSPGVYTSWEKCEDQVKGFPGNKYKRFKTQREAEAYVEENKHVEEDKVKKIYAVAVGHSPGVYETWGESQVQVDRFSGNTHKKCKTQREAEVFIDKYKRAKEQDKRLKQEQVESLSATFESLTTTDKNTSTIQDGPNP